MLTKTEEIDRSTVVITLYHNLLLHSSKYLIDSGNVRSFPEGNI